MKLTKEQEKAIAEIIQTSEEKEVVFSAKKLPFEVGEKYFFRTVTYHVIGEVEEIIGDFIVLKEGTVTWVADSGRFMAAIDDGELDEVEPVNCKAFINSGSITDSFEWKHDLPRNQK